MENKTKYGSYVRHDLYGFIWSLQQSKSWILIAKLKCYGLDQKTNAVEFFRRYLSNCYQYRKINNTLGDYPGIYTGSFIIQHILNDIFFFLKDAYLGYCADDSTLYVYNNNLQTVICNLRQEFSILSTWFYGNFMVLNLAKFHFMLFGVKKSEQFDLLCNDITPKHSSHEKILGVTIDSKLSFDEMLLISATQLTKNSTLSVE